MSSILVRGMEMPKCCYDCPFIRASVVGDFYCVAGNGIEEDLKKLYERRMSDCPLVEVKEPHGRLGDLDKLKYEIVVGNQKYLGLNEPCLEDVTPIENVDDCIDAIAFAPTIVEAEGSE